MRSDKIKQIEKELKDLRKQRRLLNKQIEEKREELRKEHPTNIEFSEDPGY